MPNKDRQPKTGWSSTISTLSLAALAFLTTTGLLIAYVPFHATMEWGVLIHTLIGLVVLLPIVWYSWIHWADYRQYNLSDALLLGYVAVLALALCLVSGVVVTWQGFFGLREWCVGVLEKRIFATGITFSFYAPDSFVVIDHQYTSGHRDGRAALAGPIDNPRVSNRYPTEIPCPQDQV